MDSNLLKIIAAVITVIVLVAFALDAVTRARIPRLRQEGLYPPPGRGSNADVERLIRLSKKLPAIKLYREINGVDLKTARLEVERMEKANPFV